MIRALCTVSRGGWTKKGRGNFFLEDEGLGSSQQEKKKWKKERREREKPPSRIPDFISLHLVLAPLVHSPPSPPAIPAGSTRYGTVTLKYSFRPISLKATCLHHARNSLSVIRAVYARRRGDLRFLAVKCSNVDSEAIPFSCHLTQMLEKYETRNDLVIQQWQEHCRASVAVFPEISEFREARSPRVFVKDSRMRIPCEGKHLCHQRYRAVSRANKWRERSRESGRCVMLQCSAWWTSSDVNETSLWTNEWERRSRENGPMNRRQTDFASNPFRNRFAVTRFALVIGIKCFVVACTFISWSALRNATRTG